MHAAVSSFSLLRMDRRNEFNRPSVGSLLRLRIVMHIKWLFTFGRKAMGKKESLMFMVQTVIFWVTTQFSLFGLDMLMD
jgi:hypothetical protein